VEERTRRKKYGTEMDIYADDGMGDAELGIGETANKRRQKKRSAQNLKLQKVKEERNRD
jgi:hypothetical protein